MSLNPLYLTHALNALLMIALPVALGIFLTRRFHLGWRLFFIGAATFILSQVGHIPFNLLVGSLYQRGVFPVPPPPWKALIEAVLLGLSAGLWEESFRYGAYRWWARDARSWGRGLLLGAGHGGIEAIILGLLVLVTFVNMITLRGADLGALVPAGQLEAAQEEIVRYWSIPWPQSLLGAVERLFALPLHLACSILVLQTFLRRQRRWVWLAVAWHALADAALVYTAGFWKGLPNGLYFLEGLTGLFALASLGIIFALRQPEPLDGSVPAELLPPQLVPAHASLPPEETRENLENTRYG